jgi:methenyltetrahydromethanopterin cyclohydrolase
MESLNRMAVELVDEAIDFADELGIEVRELESGATVLDFGVEAPGGIEAGMLLAEVQTAGLATMSTRLRSVADAPRPHVELSTDRPGLALLGAQKAGWELSTDDFEGLGSGPARALVGTEPVYEQLGYRDAFDLTVLTVETDTVPGEAVARQVAERADVPESGVFLLPFRTASVAGSVSVAARAAELAVYRLFERGYDLADVATASASAPVPPVAGDERTAMARANDAVAYGGEVHLTLRADPEAPEALVAAAADEHGRPFADVFAEADWEFGAVSREAFAPARLTVDVVGGSTHAVGRRREDVLAESFGLA